MHFKHDLREVLSESTMDDARFNSFYGTLFARGTRDTTDEAKQFVRDKCIEQMIEPTIRDRILTLIDRYSVWR
ncbi:MAG: hypothetical protein ACT4PT_00830 [Methanobacteriota archaeon]